MLAFAKKFALPELPWYLGGTLFLALTNYLTLQIPLLAKIIINGIDKTPVDSELGNTALTIVFLGLILIFIRALSRIMIFWPGRKIEANAKSHLFNRILSLPQSFFDHYGLGDLISRLANDIGHLRAFFAFAILQAMNLFFLLLFTINQMISIHSKLTLFCLMPLILMLVIARFLNPIMYKYSLTAQVAIAGLTNKVTEALVNVHIIQSNAAEKSVSEKIEVDNQSVYDANMKVLIVRQIIWPLMTLLAGLSQVTVLFYGGYEVAKGHLTLGDIMAFNVYIGYLAFPLSALGIVLSLYQRSLSALDRISVIDKEDIQTAAATATTIKTDALLDVRNLSFEYAEPNPTKKQIFSLKGISFEIKKGEHIGLFGGIGSGKSTLMDIITRLKDPPPNTVFWKGKDICGMEPSELRRVIGYGLQVPQLLSDSIEGNLQLGLSPKADRSTLARAAKEACILDEIESFTKSWDTLIGEKGIRLSGGQKQRLALARTLIRDPELLLLDDVLSAVDHDTERALIQSIHKRNCSLLVASHRPSILKQCDRVIILDNGQIKDIGPYSELALKHKELQEERSS